MEGWEQYKVIDLCPTGEAGDSKIIAFDFTEADAKWVEMRAAVNGRRVNAVPGRYTRMEVGGGLMMTDTPDEIRDHVPIIRRAAEARTVVIAGLGLGIVTRACLLNANVERVVVMELSPDVIALVEPWLSSEFGERIEVRQCDALEYRPVKGERYDLAWFDIWRGICSDNCPDIALLHKRWARRVNWYGSWRCEDARYLQRQGGMY